MLRRLQRYHLPQLLLSLFSCGHDSSPRYVYHSFLQSHAPVTVPSVPRKSERMLRAQTFDESYSVMKGYDSKTFEPSSAFMTAMHQCTQQWLSFVTQCRTNCSPVSFRQTRSDRRVRGSTLTEVTGSETAVLVTRPTRSVHREPREARTQRHIGRTACQSSFQQRSPFPQATSHERAQTSDTSCRYECSYQCFHCAQCHKVVVTVFDSRRPCPS